MKNTITATLTDRKNEIAALKEEMYNKFYDELEAAIAPLNAEIEAGYKLVDNLLAKNCKGKWVSLVELCEIINKSDDLPFTINPSHIANRMRGYCSHDLKYVIDGHSYQYDRKEVKTAAVFKCNEDGTVISDEPVYRTSVRSFIKLIK